MQVLTHDQILARISKCYHDDFQHRTSALLQADESTVWAGDYAFIDAVATNQNDSSLGYILITSYRVIRVSFRVRLGFWGKRQRFRVGQSSYFAAARPTSPLTQQEVESRLVTEITLQDIRSVDRIDTRTRVQRIETTVVELGIDCLSGRGWCGAYRLLFYDLHDGQEAYRILQREMRKEVDKTRESLVDKLERLATLHKSGVLSDAEFQTAKLKLFGE